MLPCMHVAPSVAHSVYTCNIAMQEGASTFKGEGEEKKRGLQIGEKKGKKGCTCTCRKEG